MCLALGVKVSPPPPATEAELVARAAALAGRTLGSLADELELSVPSDLRRAKGFPGMLMERALGATAASRAEPDFPALGVELKTIPVDARGHPCESTFVATIDCATIGEVEWERSVVRAKLARVLWMPIEGSRPIPVGDRRIGSALIWSPSPEEERLLRFDWEELAGVIGQGEVERMTGHLGRNLQVRPKAANSRSRRRAFDRDGARCAVLPRGFYLRASFTSALLARHFHLST
ncbi:MAG: DNA mismatch repair endonuclease MutH [Polyangiaceae bacterium]|nr:DNA mismatch repair endonuclease MutH [Polyangiaceae bacterium]